MLSSVGERVEDGLSMCGLAEDYFFGLDGLVESASEEERRLAVVEGF